MTSFAPGTNPEYAAAYNNWWFNGGQQRGEPAPNRQAFGLGSGEGQRFRPGQAQPMQPQWTPYGGVSPASMPGAPRRPGRQRPPAIGGAAQEAGQAPAWDPYHRYGYGTRDEWRAAGSPRSSRPPADQGPARAAPAGQPFRPGQAQPRPPQSTGTPYGQGGAFGGDGTWYQNAPMDGRVSGDLAAWGSQTEAQQANPGRQVKQLGNGGGWIVAGADEPPYGVPAPPAMLAPEPPGRPQSTPARPPFSSTMFDAFGNQTTPEQFYPQQQAMVSQIFGRLGQMDSGTYLGPGSPPPTWGRIPDFNYGEMWDQAGQMVQQGWQNPLQSPQPAGQQAWRQQHQAQINSQPNQSWLNSLSPANRQAYGLMQRMF